MYTIVIQQSEIVKNQAQLQKYLAVRNFMYTLVTLPSVLGCAPALILYAPLLLSPPLTCLDWFVITTEGEEGAFYSLSCLIILISNSRSL